MENYYISFMDLCYKLCSNNRKQYFRHQPAKHTSIWYKKSAQKEHIKRSWFGFSFGHCTVEVWVNWVLHFFSSCNPMTVGHKVSSLTFVAKSYASFLLKFKSST